MKTGYLKKLKLPTLKYRRLRGDMIEVYKNYSNYSLYIYIYICKKLFFRT